MLSSIYVKCNYSMLLVSSVSVMLSVMVAGLQYISMSLPYRLIM